MFNALDYSIGQDRTLLGDKVQVFCLPKGDIFACTVCAMTEAEKQKIRNAFAKRLAEAIRDAGIDGTVREIADRLETPKSTYEGWIGAKKMPVRTKSAWLAARLGVREAWLMSGIEPKTDSPTAGPLRIEHFDEEDRSTIIGVWKSLHKKYVK